LPDLWADWVGGGLDPKLFWDYSLHEIWTCLKAVNNRAKEHHKAMAWAVYHTAMLSRMEFDDWPALDELSSLDPVLPVSEYDKEVISASNLAFAAQIRDLIKCRE
jgi:hypothetical protein